MPVVFPIYLEGGDGLMRPGNQPGRFVLPGRMIIFPFFTIFSYTIMIIIARKIFALTWGFRPLNWLKVSGQPESSSRIVLSGLPNRNKRKENTVLLPLICYKLLIYLTIT